MQFLTDDYHATMENVETQVVETIPDEWVEVGNYPTLDEAFDHSLVILAMGEACRVDPAETEGQFHLQAEPLPVAAIQRELSAYGEETSIAANDRRIATERHHPFAMRSIVLWFAVMCAVFYWQGLHPETVERAASSSLGLLRDGEWWRPFTSLFFHADAPHLAGNILFGSLFLYFLVHSIGAAKAWFWMLLCGGIGNAINCWLNFPEYFQSIGASTAVFASLGLLSGLGVAEFIRIRPRLPWARIAAPFCAGFVLLGMLGSSSDPHTDVIGHVCGFSTGLIAGFAVGMWPNIKSITLPSA